MLTADRYRADGDVWRAMKLCRFEPGELDGFVPGLRRVAAEAPLPLLRGSLREATIRMVFTTRRDIPLLSHADPSR